MVTNLQLGKKGTMT